MNEQGIYEQSSSKIVALTHTQISARKGTGASSASEYGHRLSYISISDRLQQEQGLVTRELPSLLVQPRLYAIMLVDTKTISRPTNGAVNGKKSRYTAALLLLLKREVFPILECKFTTITLAAIQLICLCRSRQSTLDEHGITQEPRIPSFLSEGLLDYVIQLIVMEDEVCVLLHSFYLILKPCIPNRLSSSLTRALSVACCNLCGLHLWKKTSPTAIHSEKK